MSSLIRQGSLFPRISTLLPTLSKAERKVAEALLQDPNGVMYCSITEFADRAGVHDATVVRFCRKLGLKGYQEFKMLLAQEAAYNALQGAGEPVGEAEEGSVAAIKDRLLAMNYSALQETVALLDNTSVERAVVAMEKARRVAFYGVGSSGTTAAEGKDKFMRIGLPVETYGDSHMQAMSAALLTNEDVAVAISYSGSTMDTARTLEIAHRGGATTICITHHAKSPITHHADIVLLSGHNENPLQGGAASTKIAQLYVLDVLYALYFRRNAARAQANKSQTAAAVTDKLY